MTDSLTSVLGGRCAELAARDRELAVTIAKAADRRLVRLQCYEGLDEAKALYEWNYHKQLLRLQADEGKAWDDLEGDIFGEDFLLTRPLLEAITSPEPVVLLIDEVDRIEIETEALLLEVLDSLREIDPEAAVIMISGHGTVSTAVKAIRMGAYDYLEKPLSYNQVVDAVQEAIRRREASAAAIVRSTQSP